MSNARLSLFGDFVAHYKTPCCATLSLWLMGHLSRCAPGGPQGLAMERSPLQVTSCSCDQPGWCPRHSCHKTELWWYLCRHSFEWFTQWEQQIGPGQRENGSPRGDLMPCVHRAGTPSREVKCELCGGRREISIFACAIHGECSEHRVGTRTEWERQLPCCLTCGHYTTEAP